VSVALTNCSKENHGEPCQLYAVNDSVVWNDGTQTASSSGGNDTTGVGGTGTVAHPSLASRW
jgi:predicted heme/steroid binding protein